VIIILHCQCHRGCHGSDHMAVECHRGCHGSDHMAVECHRGCHGSDHMAVGIGTCLYVI
jgi:hypothetical protein